MTGHLKKREGEGESVTTSWATGSKIYKSPSSHGLRTVIFRKCFLRAFSPVASTILDLLVTCVPLVVVSFRSLWLTCVRVCWDFSSAGFEHPPAWLGQSLSESHPAFCFIGQSGNFRGVWVNVSKLEKANSRACWLPLTITEIIQKSHGWSCGSEVVIVRKICIGEVFVSRKICINVSLLMVGVNVKNDFFNDTSCP